MPHVKELGCCIMQEQKPISFASRSLTETKILSNLKVIACILVVFACKKQLYLWS